MKGKRSNAPGHDRLLTVALTMATGAAVAAVMIWLLPLRDSDKELAPPRL